MDVLQNLPWPNVDNPAMCRHNSKANMGKEACRYPVDYVEWLKAKKCHKGRLDAEGNNKRGKWIMSTENKPEPVQGAEEDNFPGDDELAEMEMFEE